MSISLKEKKDANKNKDAIGKITGFFLFRNLIDNYNQYKDLPDSSRKKIKRYGILSVSLSIIAIIVSLSCLVTTLINIEFQGVSVVLIMIVSILGCVVIPLIMSMYAFVFAVLQVRLNRKSIGIIGIILSILSVVSCVLLIVFLII